MAHTLTHIQTVRRIKHANGIHLKTHSIPISNGPHSNWMCPCVYVSLCMCVSDDSLCLLCTGLYWSETLRMPVYLRFSWKREQEGVRYQYNLNHKHTYAHSALQHEFYWSWSWLTHFAIISISWWMKWNNRIGRDVWFQALFFHV